MSERRGSGRGRRALGEKPAPRLRNRGWQEQRGSAARRIAILAALFGLAAVLLVGRAFQLQVLDGARYKEVALRQATGNARGEAKRGIIKDRHGAELAITIDVDSIYAEPRRLEDPRRIAALLAPILGVKVERLVEKLSGDRAFVWLKRRVTPDVAARVASLGLRGVGSRPEPKRFYSHRELAAHVIGFIGSDGEGKAGVERTMDAVLKGKAYELPGRRDALGKRMLDEDFVPGAVLEGADVYLTIDRQIQHGAEQVLARTVAESGGQAGVAIVLHASTGDILAMASAPSFNPNNLRQVEKGADLNRAISALYEPGSTMKIATIAAALEAGVVSLDDRLDCEGGSFRIGGRTIRDDVHKYGVLSLGEVMKVSSNICSAKLGVALGRERLHAALTRLGFGTKVGVELSGELGGVLRPPSTWREIALANIAFGQGLSATPLQIASMAAAVANGGERRKPRLVAKVVTKAGDVQIPPAAPPVRALEAQTARAITEMLVGVTEEGGTAPLARIPGFRVAGKTGTAQKVDPVTRAYSHHLFVASFVGFVPAERPEVVVLVLIDEPKKSIYGGQVAAPAFREIATLALAQLGIFPDDPAARAAFVAGYQASAAPETASVADGDLDDLSDGLSPGAQRLLGLGGTGAETAAWETGLAAGDAPKGGRSKNMPNFTGLRLREVLDRSAEVGCELILRGQGRVVRQSPRPGQPIPVDGRCELTLDNDVTGGSGRT